MSRHSLVGLARGNGNIHVNLIEEFNLKKNILNVKINTELIF